MAVSLGGVFVSAGDDVFFKTNVDVGEVVINIICFMFFEDMHFTCLLLELYYAPKYPQQNSVSSGVPNNPPIFSRPEW